MAVEITKTKRGFRIKRTPCPVCGEPPFGGEYCCVHVCAECRAPITSKNHIVTAKDGALFHQRCWSNA